MILDNADDARVLLGAPSTGEQADKPAFNARLDCIPPCSDGQLLVTSRTAEAAKQLVDWNDMIVVKPMSENQALTLLCNKLGIKHSKEDALQLARELDFMPLALTQAAAYIRQSAGSDREKEEDAWGIPSVHLEKQERPGVDVCPPKTA